tara:strand:+ start:5215 stop:6135 length:921 start_codon:yes stop_codon:yes gene_type:complete
MANKKISQLSEAGNVGAGDFFPVATSAGGGNFSTKKCDTETLATYVLSPVPSAISQIGFTGTNNIYFDKSNWVDTSAAGGNTHAYLMVNKTDGQLTTGSGIGNPVGGDNMGNCVATTTLNMQDNNIGNVGSEITFQDGGNIGSAAGGISVNNNTKVSLTAPEVEINGSSEIDLNGPVTVQGNLTNSGGDLTVEDIIIQKTSRHDIHNQTGSTINWSNSNIQKVITNSSSAYAFSNVLPGQTLTISVENNHSTDSIIPTFKSGTTANVIFGGTGGPPHIDAHRANVYTFICIGTGIFASAVTGYEYT